MRLVRKPRQNVSSSESPTSVPRISLEPSAAMPVATTTAIGDALYVGLHHDRVQSPVDPPAGFQDRREDRPLTKLRDPQLHIPSLGREQPRAAAFAFSGAALGPFVLARPNPLGGLHLDQLLRHDPDSSRGPDRRRHRPKRSNNSDRADWDAVIGGFSLGECLAVHTEDPADGPHLTAGPPDDPNPTTPRDSYSVSPHEPYDRPMATISVAGDNLVVEITGRDRFYALNKSTVTVPLDHVVAVGAGAQMGRPLMPGFPWLANSFPGAFTVGSYRCRGKWTFWVVHDPKQTVLVTPAKRTLFATCNRSRGSGSDHRVGQPSPQQSWT